MSNIKVLPESVVNKIAAGEVIERPASIVKELVENSLDAGAKSIEIAIRHGGKSLIRVTDDGCGMSEEDAQLAFQRHATSKISTAKDLFQIKSLGFRGEALSSIAAIARVKMTTRLPKKSTATEIKIEGGSPLKLRECAASKGTTFEVRDLFFNTPARRKFLKTDSTEMGQVSDRVTQLALSHLDVGFRFKSSDKTVLDLPAKQSLKARVSALWGKENIKDFLEVSQKSASVRMHGLIGKPSIARANRMGQLFFMNGRWIKSASLSHALMAGYYGLLMHGQFPTAVLFLEVDLARVDVNVHPTKQEVRISNEAEIRSLIKSCVTKRLESEGALAPVLKAPTTPSVLTQAVKQDWSQRSFAPSSSGGGVAQTRLAEPEAIYTVKTKKALEEPIQFRNKLKITKVLGQIHHTFIAAETEEGMILIDQHAAHERVHYEALVQNFKSKKPTRQKLLMDEIIEVHPRQREILTRSMKALGKMGFEMEAFGEKEFLIRSVPSIMQDQSAIGLIKSFLDQKEDGKLKTDLENQPEEVAAMIACKRKSVKAHDPIQADNLERLVRDLSNCKNPFSCPHGRPSFLKYTFADLEKQFKRKL